MSAQDDTAVATTSSRDVAVRSTVGGGALGSASQEAALDALARSQHDTDVSRTRVLVLRVAFGIGLVAVWQLVSGTLVEERTISSPDLVADRLWEWSSDGTLWSNTWVTLQETMIGFLIGAVGGIAIGIGLGLMRRLGDIITPYVMGLYALPKLALAPLFIVWFGIGASMKIAMGAVLVFFLVFLNAMAGVRNVDEAMIDDLRVMGARQRHILWKLTLPGSMSSIVLGLKMAVPYALIGAVVGELVAATEGLGFLVMNSSAQYDTAGVFACLAVLGALALAMNQGVEWLEHRALGWKTTSR